MLGGRASTPPAVSCSIVVINGFAVTATVIVTGPEEVPLPDDDPDDEHAASASNPVVAIAGSAIILLRLVRRMSTVLLLEIVPRDRQDRAAGAADSNSAAPCRRPTSCRLTWSATCLHCLSPCAGSQIACGSAAGPSPGRTR